MSLQSDINFIRKYPGSPVYMGPEANRVVDELEELKKVLSKYLSYASSDGRKERMIVRNELVNLIKD